MKKLLILLATCVLATAAFAASPAKPGKWEMTMQTEMSGMAMKIPPQTVTYCLTKEEAENPENLAPENRKNADCQRTDLKVDGNTVSWKIECRKSRMTGEGKVTYSENTFDGSSHITTATGNEVKAKFSGKYLGACDK